MTTSSTRQCWFRNAHRFSFIFWSFWISNNNCTAIKINNTYINVLDIQRFLWRSYTSLTSRIKQSYPSPFPPETSQNEKANAVLWSQMASNEPFMATLARKVAAYSWTPDIGKCVKDHAWFGKKNGYTLFCSFWLAFQHDLCAWCYWNTLLCAKPWTLS